jgi:hypothetical protein
VTGGAVIALVVVLEKLLERPLPRWTYLLLFLVIFVVMSSFIAWQSERQAGTKKAQDLGNQVTQLSTQLEGVRRRLDDRREQQEFANKYADMLQMGRKRLVEWTGRISELKPEPIQLARKESMQWLENVKSSLKTDFDDAALYRFNLGIPKGSILGMSEIQEQQARLETLDQMIFEMRAGTFHLPVKRD